MDLSDRGWEGKDPQSPEATAVQDRLGLRRQTSPWFSWALSCSAFILSLLSTQPEAVAGHAAAQKRIPHFIHSSQISTWLTQHSNADRAYQSLALAFTFHVSSKSLNKYKLLEISDIAGQVFQVAGGAEVN